MFLKLPQLRNDEKTNYINGATYNQPTTISGQGKNINIWNYIIIMVEAAGVEPASENIPLRHLHTYPEF